MASGAKIPVYPQQAGDQVQGWAGSSQPQQNCEAHQSGILACVLEVKFCPVPPSSAAIMTPKFSSVPGRLRVWDGAHNSYEDLCGKLCSCLTLLNPYNQPGRYILILIMGRKGLKEVKYLAQSHTAIEQLSLNSNSGLVPALVQDTNHTRKLTPALASPLCPPAPSAHRPPISKQSDDFTARSGSHVVRKSEAV